MSERIHVFLLAGAVAALFCLTPAAAQEGLDAPEPAGTEPPTDAADGEPEASVDRLKDQASDALEPLRKDRDGGHEADDADHGETDGGDHGEADDADPEDEPGSDRPPLGSLTDGLAPVTGQVADLTGTVGGVATDLQDALPLKSPAQDRGPEDEPAPPSETMAPQQDAASRDVTGPPTLVWAAAALGATGLALAATQTSSIAAGSRLPWRRILLAGFTRFARDTVLHNSKREAIYNVIRTEPGVHVQSLSDRLDLSRTTVVHHLKLLRQHRLVWSERRGRTRHFFATTDGHAPADRDACVALRNENTRRVARHVATHPGATQQEICQALGMSASMVHDHTKRITDAGLLRKERRGRFVEYHPRAELAAVSPT